VAYPVSRAAADVERKSASFADAIRKASNSEESNAETSAPRQQRVRAPDKQVQTADNTTDARAEDVRTGEPERERESDTPDEAEVSGLPEATADPIVLSLAAAVNAPIPSEMQDAQNAQNAQNAQSAEIQVTAAKAAEQTDVSVLGGKITDWSLPGPGETAPAIPPEPRDTARMPENPAADTIHESAIEYIAPKESEPCPPENENVKSSESASNVRAASAEGPELRAPIPETRGAEAERPVSESDYSVPIAAPARASESEKEPDAGESDEPPRESAGKTEKTPEVRAFSLASERIVSDGALRASASSSFGQEGVPVENVVPAMIERIEIMAADGQKTMSLDLKPEYLGRVNMTLVSEAGGVSVKIRADDPGVRSAINSEIAGIIERLSERGIRVNGVELTETRSGGAGPDTYGYSQESYSGGAGRGFGTGARARYRTTGRVGETGGAIEAVATATTTAEVLRPAVSRALMPGYDSRGRWNDGEIYDGDAYDGNFGVEYSA
jgi:flagellar hook-length control protein FliK